MSGQRQLLDSICEISKPCLHPSMRTQDPGMGTDDLGPRVKLDLPLASLAVL